MSRTYFLPDPAQGFGRHPHHGGEVLQGHFIKKRRIVLEQPFVTVFSAHGQQGVHALFHKYKTTGNEQFFELVPFGNGLFNGIVFRTVEGITFAIGERLDIVS